jgi:hypothetical protein
LKRSLKIKAFLVLFAWGVVFMHGVIPHIHPNEQPGNCNSLLHDIDEKEHGNNDPDHFRGIHTDHEKVCHFATIMLQQQGFDDILCNTNQRTQTIIYSKLLSVNKYDQVFNISQQETGPSQLRAPPSA